MYGIGVNKCIMLNKVNERAVNFLLEFIEMELENHKQTFSAAIYISVSYKSKYQGQLNYVFPRR